MMNRFSAVLRPLLLALFLLAGPWTAQARAQEEEGTAWEVQAELGAAVFFGNTSQTTFTTRVGAESADSVRELDLDGRFSYGQATDEEGVTSVNKRTWTLASSIDYGPYNRWSPFLFAELERSFERRIDLRYNLGAGGKYTLQRSDRGNVDLSAALLAERTHPADGLAEDFDDSLLARWSIRARARRSWEEGRLAFESENSWRPRFEEFGNFTFTSTSSVAFDLNETVSLKLTFVDSYDSEAQERGARTNNDGQLFLTLLSSF